MIRKTFKRDQDKPKGKIGRLIDKYNLPREYLYVNRKSISRGMLVGLFWGFIPMPFQMAGVLVVTPLMRFNVPIAIAMVWLSNPFTMPFMYYMEYLTGNFILGRDGISNIELTLEWFSQYWDDIFVPLYVGASFYSIVGSSIVYMTVNFLWIYSVKKERCTAKNKRDNNQKQ